MVSSFQKARFVVSFVLFRFVFALLDSKQASFLSSLEEYTIVHPVKVTEEGKFLSHDLHHSKVLLRNDKARQRRQIPAQAENDMTSAAVHYRLPLQGQPHVLRLWPNDMLFFSDGLTVERRRGSGNPSRKDRFRGDHCFYQGHLHEMQNDSRVALATCGGLSGYIQLGTKEYLIEPLKEGLQGKEGIDKPQPHVVYRRTPAIRSTKGQEVNNTAHECGSTSFPSGWAKRMSWERARKRTAPLDRRRKRSVSMERNVEALVVADKSMLDYYSGEDVITYILTVMNMVSSLYHDASIGNAINVVLVKVFLLEAQEEDLVISHHADQTLKSFCRWQKFVNPEDTDPEHHDVAILLTRFNICTKVNEPCSTLGLAEVAGMCQPQRSCNVNEDTGLALAYTIAHEMGHNFGMSHDGPQNGCQAPSGQRQHVMSPHLNSDTSPLIWSNCSRVEITKFLDRDWGTCLDDQPSSQDYVFPELPPGAMYDADHQCRLQYGAQAEYCDGIEDVCQTLWCRQDNKCVTRLEPAAQGTRCGKDKWCFVGQCLEMGERPDAIDGEWGAWSPWTTCSRSCQAGVSSSTRHCDNPPPAHGGRYCIGERRRYRICNTEVCPENVPSFRSVQCSQYNSVPYKNELYAWVPVSTPSTPCQLHCKPEGQFFSVMLSDTVEDGTPCRPGTRDLCINGKCRRVACDWKIDSEAQEDRCGLCHGDGTQCQTIKGTFDQKQGQGYVMVTTVPAGARNLRVEEVSEANNYISIRNGATGQFLLNGQWLIQWSGEYQAAGTTLFYQREGERETLQAPGPMQYDLDILILFQTSNPGVIYEYTVPYKNVTRKPEFHWEYSDWSVCSATCGGGVQVSKARCMEKEAGHVEDKYCNSMARPELISRLCNKHTCPAKWWTGPWQHCSATCGNLGVRRRTVICVRALGPDEQLALKEEDCDQSEKPEDIQPCHHKHPCPGDDNWALGPWGQCSKSCGGGQQVRSVSCKTSHSCSPKEKPPSVSSCNVHPCPSESEVSRSTPGLHDHSASANTDERPAKQPFTDFGSWSRKQQQQQEPHHQSRGAKARKKVRNRHQQSRLSERPHGIVKDVSHTLALEIPAPVQSIRNKFHPEGIPRTEIEVSDERTTYLEDFDEEPLLSIKEPTKEDQPLNTLESHGRSDKSQRYEWHIGDWKECSCAEGLRRRRVWCQDPSGKCSSRLRPHFSESCVPNCLKWVAGPWSQCSKTCGGGVQLRHVNCVNMTSQVPTRGCRTEEEPTRRTSCNVIDCPDNKAALNECEDNAGEEVCKFLQHMCHSSFLRIKCCATCDSLQKNHHLRHNHHQRHWRHR